MKVHFSQPDQVTDELFKYAVIAARYQDQWVFCRHRARNTWEIPGGHREKGESIADTAARELAEETGALQAEIVPVSAYGVERENGITWGMLYLARIEELGELPPDSEIGEVGFFDRMPDELTYPAIQPHLYREIQNWLNLQSKADELWDIYDENRQLTGRLQRRGDPMQEGDYHLSVHVWMQNSRGEFLITQRSPNKGYPLMWESTGGSALTGDDSLTAALREVEEETGLQLKKENGKVLLSLKRTNDFCDVWYFRQDFDLKDVILQEGETVDKKYATAREIIAMRDQGEFVPFRYLDQLLDMIDKENG